MLRIENLSLQLDDFQLKAIDLEIKKGECHALLGPSGSGKSTLVSTILGLKKPDSGHLYLEERIIDRWSVESRAFGYLPQNLALFPHLNVEKNLRYGIKARKLESAETERHLQDLIDTVQIRPLLHRMPATLSGGERQRVALVRALAPQPNLLLLDEPFSALDSHLRRELWNLVLRIRQEFETTMLLITHDLAEAFYLSDSISILIDGKIRQSGKREEIFFHPKSEKIARYLGIRNIFTANYIGKKVDKFLFDVPELGSTLQANHPPHQPRDKQLLAIRPESIRISERVDDNNRIEGEIETLPMGSSTLGIFTPVQGTGTLELQLHGYSPLEQKKKVYVTISSKDVILLNE
ncbi:ABC transporter ATP-binding protein [Nitratifractor sp.]